MKNIKKVIITILVMAIMLGMINTKVQASTPDAYMIVANPGEDSSYEINIGWHTDVEYTKSYVIYTTKDDVNWENQIKVFGKYEYTDLFNGISSKSKDGKDITEDAIFLDYSATLKDLLPATEYMYRVGQNILSEIQYFKTAGESKFSFAWISDFHAYSPLPNRLASAMDMLETLDEYNNGFDFVFSTGDEIAWGGSYSFWGDLFNEKYHKNYMWASVIGNHDYMDRTSTKSTNKFFKTVYNFPTNGYEGEEGVCYYFKYGNVLFITMDNETQKNDTEVKKAQDWFEKVVTENPAQYIVVAQHYQWFEGINGSFNNASGYGRWKELFDKYNVDVAMSGNNHIYVRSKLLYQDSVSDDYNYGTTYIQASSSDNERGQTLKDLKYNQDVIEHRFSEGGNTVSGMIVNVTEEEFKIELLKRDGSIEDSVVIKSRRDLYPMTGFNKESFENNIDYIDATNENKGLLIFDQKGFGYVKSITIKNDDKVIVAKTIKKKYDFYITLTELQYNDINNIEIIITYKDKTTKKINYQFKPIKVEGKISNLNVEINTEGYKVTFNNTYNDLDQLKVYLNDSLIFIKEGNINEFVIPVNKCSFSDIIKIEAIKGESIISSKEINYYSSTDLNCDGLENEDDVKYLQNIICENIELDDKLLSFYDINNDGSIDIIDATYLSMYINEKISQPVLKQFTVTFINIDGSVIDTVLVEAGKTTVIDNPQFEDRIFIGWDTDYSLVTRDIVVKALFVEK